MEKNDIAQLAELSQGSDDDNKGFLGPDPKTAANNASKEESRYKDNDSDSVSSSYSTHSKSNSKHRSNDDPPVDRQPTLDAATNSHELERRPSTSSSSGSSLRRHRYRENQQQNEKSNYDYYQNRPPRYNRPRTQPVQSKEDMVKAEKLMTKIKMYENLGYNVDVSLTLKSPIEALESQVLKCIAHRKRKTAVLTMQSSLLMFVGFMEFAAVELHRFSPKMNFRLKGLSESINEDIQEYDGLLGELYEDHSDFMPNNPWFALAAMLANAAKMQHNKNVEKENSLREEVTKWEHQRAMQQQQLQYQQTQQQQPSPGQNYNQKPPFEQNQSQHLVQTYLQPQVTRPSPSVAPSEHLLQRINKFETSAATTMPTTSQPPRPMAMKPLAEARIQDAGFASPVSRPPQSNLVPQISPTGGRAQLSPSVVRLSNGNISQGLTLM